MSNAIAEKLEVPTRSVKALSLARQAPAAVRDLPLNAQLLLGNLYASTNPVELSADPRKYQKARKLGRMVVRGGTSAVIGFGASRGYPVPLPSGHDNMGLNH